MKKIISQNGVSIEDILIVPNGRSMTAATALIDFPFSLQQHTNQNIHVLMPMSLSFCYFMFLCYKAVCRK